MQFLSLGQWILVMSLLLSFILQLAFQLLHWVITEDTANHAHSFVDPECLHIVAFTCYNSSTFLPSKENTYYIIQTLECWYIYDFPRSLLGYKPQPFIPYPVIMLTECINKWLHLTGSCLNATVKYIKIFCIDEYSAEQWTIPVLQSHKTKADHLCDINLCGPLSSSNTTKHTTFMCETCLLLVNYHLHWSSLLVNYCLCWFWWSHFINSTGILLPKNKV